MTVALNPTKPLGKRFRKRMEGIVWNFLQGRMGSVFFWGAKFCTLATKSKIKCPSVQRAFIQGKKKKKGTKVDNF
jgi:hypothetical protein